MFVEALEKRNPNLIKAAFKLHQNAEISPDTYIIDLDAVLHNGKILVDEAKKNGIELYIMTKQFGRNPLVAKKLMELGFSGVVVVDYKEAEIMIDNNIKIGNVGHLVQIPKSLLKKIISANPEIITVYSIEKAKEINEVSKSLGIVQNIMIRVLEEDSEIYSGQKGGVYISQLPDFANEVKKLNNIRISGVTSFPCFLYSSNENDILPTKNIQSIEKAIIILEKLGFNLTQINLPSGTSMANIYKIKNLGGTHGEPGHALTGTTPYNSKNFKDEIPALVYVTEVSHNLDNTSFTYGGGHYRRSGMEFAIVGKSFETSKKYKISAPTLESIDYHFELSENAIVSDTVLAAFRTQIFVTRSDVAVVSGISTGNIKILGIYDSQGRVIK